MCVFFQSFYVTLPWTLSVITSSTPFLVFHMQHIAILDGFTAILRRKKTLRTSRLRCSRAIIIMPKLQIRKNIHMFLETSHKAFTIPSGLEEHRGTCDRSIIIMAAFEINTSPPPADTYDTGNVMVQNTRNTWHVEEITQRKGWVTTVRL